MYNLKTQKPGRVAYLPIYNSMKRRLQLISQKFKDISGARSTFGDRVVVADEILVYEGVGENKKLKFASKGHIVNQGLQAIINFLAQSTGTIDTNNGWYMRVGTGGSVTTGATNALTSPDGTASSTSGGQTTSPGSSYRIAWTATWNSGSLSAITITELGLFLKIDGSLNTFNTAWSAAVQLFSRLSEADGDFTGFLVNTTVPLTIEWRLTLTFA